MAARKKAPKFKTKAAKQKQQKRVAGVVKAETKKGSSKKVAQAKAAAKEKKSGKRPGKRRR